MTAHTRISGSWADVNAIHAKVSGSWKEVTEGYTKVSGSWKQFYAPAAAGAYDLLETQVLSSSAASVTFTGLGSYSDYKHLQIRIVALSTRTSADTITMDFNGDTGTNYARHRLQGNGSSVSSSAFTSETGIPASLAGGTNVTNWVGSGVVDILDFSNTSKYKTIRALRGISGATNLIHLGSGLWLSTNAITSIRFTANNGNVNTGSRFSIYGIR